MSQPAHHASGETEPKGIRSERPTWVRYPCTPESFCVQPATAPGNACMVKARDISRSGLGLVLKQELRPDMLVSVELLTAAGRLSKPRAARVVQVVPLEGGGWLVNCSWVNPLGEDELGALA